MITRHIVNFNDTGTAVYYTGKINGKLEAFRYSADGGDTGTTLGVSPMPNDADTGDGYLYYTNGTMGVDWFQQATTAVPLAGEKIQCKVLAGGTGTTQGRLYIYIDEGGK